MNIKHGTLGGSLMILLLTASLALSPCAFAEDKAFLEQAQKEVDSKKLTDRTFAQLQEFVQKNPTNSQAHITLGLALNDLGLTEDAAMQFELAVRHGADNPRALVELCKSQIRLGRVEAAIFVLNQGLEKFPNDPEMLYLVGDFLLKEKRIREAIAILKRAYEINPKIPHLPTAYGAAVMDTNPQMAAKLATEDLARYPKDERASRVRGFSYRRMGEYEKGARDLKIVFDLLPVMPNTSDALSDCYFYTGKYEKAVRPSVFLVAFTSFPDVEQSGNISKLVRVLRKLPEHTASRLVSKAEEEIDSRYKNKADYHYSLGKAYDQADLPNAAMEEYKKAIVMDSKYVRAYYRLGLDQELILRDYKTALANYDMAYKLRPWDKEVALAYDRLQDRLSNRKGDVAWKWKDWLSKMLNVN